MRENKNRDVIVSVFVLIKNFIFVMFFKCNAEQTAHHYTVGRSVDADVFVELRKCGEINRLHVHAEKLRHVCVEVR